MEDVDAISPMSHHSPGPPDVAPEDEDSQDSMTLQNALRPLPDTQNGSSENSHSSPTERNGGLQLLSRPQNLEVDPGESFLWGKPVKIIPGQFSRPAPTRSMLDTVKEKASASSLVTTGNLTTNGRDAIADSSGQPLPVASRKFGDSVSPRLRLPVEESARINVHSINGGLNPEETDRSVANEGEQLPQVDPSTRRPPFEDCVPPYRRSDVQVQASFAQTSACRVAHPDDSSTGEQQDHVTPQLESRAPRVEKISTEHRRGTHNPVTQRLHQDQLTTPVQTDGPRQRISLPNDTSVSPAQASRALPQETSQCRGLREDLARKKALGLSPYISLNRPMRDTRQVTKLKTPTPRPSSCSSAHGSNISKKRSRPRPTPLSGLHQPRSRHSRRHNDTPSIRLRDRQHAASHPSPVIEEGPQQSNESIDIDMMAGNLAQALNNNFGMMKDEWRRKEQDIAYLEHNLRKQAEKLSNFRKQSAGKSGRIQELEEDHSRLQEQLESANQQLEDRSNKLSELQKKCRTYKEHLNSATAEQQELYMASKAKCETAIQHMREEEHKRKMLDEQHRKDLQATRERLTEVVKSTVAEYSSKEREFNVKLESLQQRAQEREADVQRERETIRKLLEQTATIKSVQDTMKTYGAQIAQINTKMGDLASFQQNRDGAAVEEIQIKLDKIVGHLSTLDERVEPQASFIDKMQEANVKTFSNLLDPVLRSNTEIQSNMNELADAVEDYMEDFWMRLEDREDVLVELLDKTKEENRQLQADAQLREEECNILSFQLEEAGVAVRQSESELENLRSDIAELEQAQANDMEQAERANSLHEECEKLKMDIIAKAAISSDLEGRLRDCQEALQNEKEQHKSHTQTLQKLVEQHDENARLVREAAVELARQEVTHDMDIAKENLSMLLKQTEAERTALKQQLDATKQQVSMAQEENKRSGTTVNELRSELEIAQANANRLGKEVHEKDMEAQKAIDHNSKEVTGLEAKIAQKESELARLSEDAQAYDKKLQEALDGLKEWARGHQAVKSLFSELRKAQGGDLDGVNPKLKAILEIDMLHQAIFRCCQSQGGLTPDGDQETADETIASGDAGVDRLPGSSSEPRSRKSLATRVLDQIGRRVTIRSPRHSVSSPNPPSVSAEQEHRRSADPPKSIMKASSQSIIKDEDLHATAEPVSLPTRGSFGRRAFKRLPLARAREGEVQDQTHQDSSTITRSNFVRAPYNRPVSGTKTTADNNVSQAEIRVERDSTKRKQGSRRVADSAVKQASGSTEEQSPRRVVQHLSPPEGQVSQAGELQEPPDAPRKRARKNTDDSISPVRSLYFEQSGSMGERETKKKGHKQRRRTEDVVSSGRGASTAPKDKGKKRARRASPSAHTSPMVLQLLLQRDMKSDFRDPLTTRGRCNVGVVEDCEEWWDLQGTALATGGRFNSEEACLISGSLISAGLGNRERGEDGRHVACDE
ncbi:hypothetical protein KVR01_000618 [Diaporthe batatas]|uniref:uncharacterized protein n=1 Tax=Diaporthe batatas TaxID=748121 RepID=UPI001D04A34B|nr:uncharacterized protein KVR01_000618 [Diaporthe batatas]KAG8169873.1 hypothetical protein KVR01_000618 [Diaporthe batatas]